MITQGIAPDRVVLINDHAAPRGGTAVMATNLARGLAATGTAVTFFAGDDGDPPAPGVRLVALGGRPLLQSGRLHAMASGIYNVQAARALAGLIAREDTPRTIYHVHGWAQILSPSIFRALAPVAERVVIHAHDFGLACPNVMYFNFRTAQTCPLRPMSGACLATNCDKRSYAQKMWRVARQAVLSRALRPLLEHAPILAVHEGMEPYLRRTLIGARIIGIRNPAKAFLETPVKAERNTDFFFLGELNEFKGPTDLARAAHQAGVPIQVLGDGPCRDEVQALCPDARLLGWRPRAELPALLSRARAVVVPSRGPEPFGLVAVEALASGIPVILSDSMLLAPPITAQGMGLAYPAGDVAALAAILARVAQDDALVAAMSRQAARAGGAIASSQSGWIAQMKQIYARQLAAADGHADTAPGAAPKPAPALETEGTQ